MSHPETDNPLGKELLEFIQRRLDESTLTFQTTLPPQRAQYAQWPEWVLPQLREKLVEGGVGKLYRHQAELAQAAWEGEDAVIATGTSSGKSLGYQLPILSRLAQEPTACALYLTPTKALGSDQLQAVLELCRGIPALKTVVPAPYDGDTPQESRAGVRDHSRFIFSNPDMVHMLSLIHI